MLQRLIPKRLFLFTMCLHTAIITTLAQQKSHMGIRESIVAKWAKATVNIETRTIVDYKVLDSFHARLQSKLITQEVYQQLLDEEYAKIERKTGTAIFIKHQNKHFLVSARHVIVHHFDTSTGEPKLFDAFFLIQNFKQKAKPVSDAFFGES